MPSARPFVFRRSARLFVIRLVMLLLVTFFGLALLMRSDWQAAGIITGLAGLVAAVWYVLTKHLRNSIRIDDTCIERTDPRDPVRIRWVDVTELSIGETMLPFRSGPLPVRFALIRGLGSRRIAFADLASIDNRPVWVGASEPTPITSVVDSDVLLGMVADQVEASELLPQSDSEDRPAHQGEDGEDDPSGSQSHAGRRVGVGFLALLLKMGGKALKPIATLFKGGQGLVALVSLGFWAFLFSWKGALALVVFLLIHEYGHVHAMRRARMKVKGVYWIPLLGAATVPETGFRTRWEQAAVALGGPLWSSALNLVPVILIAATGNSIPELPRLAAFWALLNLLNLLPINPLDGGRILKAVMYSINSRAGLMASLGTIFAGVGLATAAGFYLFVLLGIMGVLELLSEKTASARLQRLSFTKTLRDVGAEELARLRVLTRPAYPETTEIKVRQIELSRLRNTLQLARITPMRPAQAGLWTGVYFATVIGVSAVLLWAASLDPELRALLTLLT